MKLVRRLVGMALQGLAIAGLAEGAIARTLPLDRLATGRGEQVSQVIIIDPGYPQYPRYERRPRRLPAPPDALPPVSSQDCVALTAMSRLAYVWNAGSNLSEEVTGGQIGACLGRERSPSSLTRWRNGQPAIVNSSLFYPNGISARFGNSWNYPNGQTANASGSWFYPNGQSAKFGPYWYTPNGRAGSEQDLIAWACSELSSRRCNSRLQAVRRASRFWYELTLVELAWIAYDQY